MKKALIDIADLERYVSKLVVFQPGCEFIERVKIARDLGSVSYENWRVVAWQGKASMSDVENALTKVYVECLGKFSLT